MQRRRNALKCVLRAVLYDLRTKNKGQTHRKQDLVPVIIFLVSTMNENSQYSSAYLDFHQRHAMLLQMAE